MGNCQAAEAATLVVQHPGGKVDRIYWSVCANQIMNSNPGHYVAQVVAAQKEDNGAPPVKQVKVLRPDDTLIIGQVYRLISFEDVLKGFAAKKCIKLDRILKARGDLDTGCEQCSNSQSISINKAIELMELLDGFIQFDGVELSWHSHIPSMGSSSRGVVRHHGGGGQWRPALQSISELGGT
ncbi:hypothetical protein OROGR_023649 [Orobanche gracilis]